MHRRFRERLRHRFKLFRNDKHLSAAFSNPAYGNVDELGYGSQSTQSSPGSSSQQTMTSCSHPLRVEPASFASIRQQTRHRRRTRRPNSLGWLLTAFSKLCDASHTAADGMAWTECLIFPCRAVSSTRPKSSACFSAPVLLRSPDALSSFLSSRASSQSVSTGWSVLSSHVPTRSDARPSVRASYSPVLS